MQKTSLRLIAACVLGALALGACGNSNGDDALDDVGLPDDEPGTVEVTGFDYGYRDTPATVEAGTEFTLANTSEAEVHEIVALRVNDEETRPAAELLQLPPEEQQDVATMVGVVVTFPDGESAAPQGPLVLDEPGRYIFACFVPEGADPDEFRGAMAGAEGPPDVEGGPPHVALGMFAELTVNS